MGKMFWYLTGKLDKKEQRTWKLYAVFDLVTPVTDIFSFSVIIYVINKLLREEWASERVVYFLFFMIILSLLKCLFELYQSKISTRFIYVGSQKLSMKIYELMIKEELTEHNEKTAMQILNMVRNDSLSCIWIIVDCIKIVTNSITMAGYAIVLIYVSKWVGMVSIVALFLFMVYMSNRIRKQMVTYGEKSRICSIKVNSQITIAYGSFKEMKIDDRSAFVLGKYENASNEYAKIQAEYKYKNSNISIIMQNLIMAAMFLVLAVVLVYGVNLAAILTSMVVYITVLMRMLNIVNGILNRMNNVEFAQKSYEAVRERLTAYEALKEAEEKFSHIRRKKLTFQEGVSVRNLTFSYNDRAPIFKEAFIDIPAGCSVAIIGISGAGKTTFVDLLLGLLKPSSGHIFFDDYDIVEQRDSEGSCRASIGELVSYIPQIVYLNGETIQNNVALFEDEGEIDNAKVEECLKCAQIWEDVMRMPEGVHTLIGENGLALSGGQRQRVALARALYKDFELLVMDEATAALDMDTEKAVIDSIRQIKENKTLLMVTHHMNLANECDMIYKIENKKFVKMKGK